MKTDIFWNMPLSKKGLFPFKKKSNWNFSSGVPCIIIKKWKQDGWSLQKTRVTILTHNHQISFRIILVNCSMGNDEKYTLADRNSL